MFSERFTGVCGVRSSCDGKEGSLYIALLYVGTLGGRVCSALRHGGGGRGLLSYGNAHSEHRGCVGSGKMKFDGRGEDKSRVGACGVN